MNQPQLKRIKETLESTISQIWHVGFPTPELIEICKALEAEADKLRAITEEKKQ